MGIIVTNDFGGVFQAGNHLGIELGQVVQRWTCEKGSSRMTGMRYSFRLSEEGVPGETEGKFETGLIVGSVEFNTS